MTVTKKARGIPSKFTDELFQTVCERIADGEPLRQICRSEGMPTYKTIYNWIDEDNKLLQSNDEEVRSASKHLSTRFARAREDGHDAIAEETMQIADDGTNDWMENKSKEGEIVGWKLNGEHVQRSKLRIETRLKLLAKWNPKKYGDKVELSGPGEQGEHIFKNTSAAPQLPKEEWLKAHGIDLPK
ncbi:hypothetical protein ACFQ2T_04955 [Methylophilus flavus]|uniref:Terminase small subunit protein n=1 Tax=Methylophilus flavus TaxID=640084 RepID=A0ABW3PA88_9PROT